MVAAETGGGEARGRHVGSKNTTSAEGTPDARGTLMQRKDLSSVLASPGEDTQHDDFEREEREDLTNVHLTGLYSFGAAATPSRRSPQGRRPGEIGVVHPSEGTRRRGCIPLRLRRRYCTLKLMSALSCTKLSHTQDPE